MHAFPAQPFRYVGKYCRGTAALIAWAWLTPIVFCATNGMRPPFLLLRPTVEGKQQRWVNRRS
jgi:hypothetical protein